jgi:hypothetical protein
MASRGRCVGLLTSPNAGDSPLAADDCDAAWAAAQTFEFDFLDDHSVRIKTSGGSCVKWPPLAQALPLLGVCDGSNEAFAPRDGHLEHAGQCLGVDAGSIKAEPCSDVLDQRFSISGPLELSNGALTLSVTTDAGSITTAPLAWPPSAGYVFDYHF